MPACAYFYRLVVLISLAGCFEFYDLFFTAYVAPALFKAGLFTPTTAGLFDLKGFAAFAASLFAGLWIGTSAFGWMADRYGRRRTFAFALLWYSAGTLVMAFQKGAAGIDLWRFIASIGIGVELVTIDAYVAELVPKDVRGKAFALSQCICFCAVPMAALLSWWLAPLAPLGIDGWRWVVIVGSLGALPIGLIVRRVPESPRWLSLHGRTQEALTVVEAMEEQVRDELGSLPEPSVEASAAPEKPAAWSAMWKRPYRSRTLLMIAFNILQTIGFYGFSTWAPTYLLSHGITTTKSLQYAFVIAVAMPLGPLLGMLVADRFERKWQVCAAALGVAGFGLLFAHQRAALPVISLGIAVTLCNAWMSFAYHAYQAEIFPTQIRGNAIGFVYSFSRLSAVFTSFIIGYLLKGYGPAGVFAFIALCMLGVAICVGGFGPRTNHRRLEDLAAG